MMDTGENMLSVLNDRLSVARDLDFGEDIKRLDSNCCSNSQRNALPNIELNDNYHSSLTSYEGKMLPDGALFNRLDFLTFLFFFFIFMFLNPVSAYNHMRKTFLSNQ